ncbi:Smr/MutS family protein [Zooshikella harenae]|uniref:Smr/MutS family protein n=1 Tax=Zooshikella harenae TaxID=2827238 RepID=A0ABS5ZEH8_9GAMM|nr:Smr/MutS family protein [Zooshikella harenae]MBU2712474.1 Smr/MutS family protein [Zooshikella harenae]
MADAKHPPDAVQADSSNTLNNSKALNEEDKAAFNEAMKGVKRYQHNKVIHTSSEPHPHHAALPTRRLAAEQAITQDVDGLSDSLLLPLGPEASVEYRRSGVQLNRMRKLKQGQLPVEYCLDLHGYRVEEARTTLMAFLGFAQANNMRCVKIIHGKSHRRKSSRPTLKDYLNTWLRQIPCVQAFCTTPPVDGGAGSMYVLVNRQQHRKNE